MSEMMIYRIQGAMVSCFVLLLGMGCAHAAERARPDEAKALAQKAAAFMRANLASPEKAFRAFTNDPVWQDRELYVTVRMKDGTSLVHPKQPAVVGKNQIDLKDVDGRPLVREIVSCMTECWAYYKWKNYSNNTIEMKSSYVVAVGDYRILVGSYIPR